MNKKELLLLHDSARFTLPELRSQNSALAKLLWERLQRIAVRKAATQLAGASEQLRTLVKEIELPSDEASSRQSFRVVVLKSLREIASKKGKRLGGLQKELNALEAAANSSAETDATMDDALRLSEPIESHPDFQLTLQAAEVYRLSDTTGLGDQVAEVLIRELRTIGAINDAALKTLITEGKLTQIQATSAGLSSCLYNLLDCRLGLVAIVKPRVKSVADLAAIETSTWAMLVKASNPELPSGTTVQQYAGQLRQRAQQLGPSKAIAPYVKRSNAAQPSKQVQASPPPSKGATNAPSATATTVTATASTALSATSKTTPLTKAETKRRQALTTRFFANNPDVLGTDLTAGSKATQLLKFDPRASEDDKQRILATARDYQRLFAVTSNQGAAQALASGGYRSAHSLAVSRPREIAERTGLSLDVASQYSEKARRLALSVTARAGTVIDLMASNYAAKAARNASAAIGGYLKEIPGYADFFGEQRFFSCNHCQSILGPAAYFVDLMHFVDEEITDKFFTQKPDHPLSLKTRRPDLWTLPLTCENTNTELPYLEIINEILENASAMIDVGGSKAELKLVEDAIAASERAALVTAVYSEILPDRFQSVQQPFNLAVQTLLAYLSPLGNTLAQMAQAGNAEGECLARLRLELPPADFALISTPNADLTFLAAVFGCDSQSEFTLDPPRVLKALGVDWSTLIDLLNTQFIGESIAESEAGALLPELTVKSLDRLHRFIRLWRATGWRVGELDLVLSHLEAEEVGENLDVPALCGIASVQYLQKKWNISVEEQLALWSTVPNCAVLRSSAPTASATRVSPTGPLTISLFDRRFNPKNFVEKDGEYPKEDVYYLHPSLAQPGTIPDPNQQRLLLGLGATAEELLQLIIGLADPLGIDPESDLDTDKAFPLDECNLGILYGHLRAAKLLKLTVPELFALLTIAGLPTPFVDSLADLEALARAHDWVTSTGWSIGDIAYICRRAESLTRVESGGDLQLPTPDAKIQDGKEVAKALVDQIAKTGLLLFTDTVFTALPHTPPIVTSSEPVLSAIGTESVTYTVAIAGKQKDPETIQLGTDSDLDAVVADWNSQAKLTRAYRSDVRGLETKTGRYLSVAVEGATGAATKLIISTAPAEVLVQGEYAGVEVTEAQSRELLAANQGLVEMVGADQKYRLKADFDPSAPLTIPPSVNQALMPALQELLAGYHSRQLLISLLPKGISIGAAVLPHFVTMLEAELDSELFFRELRGELPPLETAQLINELQTLRLLFKDNKVFLPERLEFISAERELFAIDNFHTLTLQGLHSLETYRKLIKPWIARQEPVPDLEAILEAFDSDPEVLFSDADQSELAKLLGCEQSLLRSLLQYLSFGSEPFVVLQQLTDAVAFAQPLRVDGQTLALVQSTSYQDLAAASAAVQAAFRAQYPDESEWQKKVEPIENGLLSRKRDGLVAYLIHSGSRFDEVTDLYSYFLLDVELEGCARTSRIASAIDSVQLYVHRCLMNLEETRQGDINPIHVLPDDIPREEWDWRKNYRVWEANRKVFLYPENYLEPETRDNKSPLFKELEEELLSKKVTDEAALEAYAKYLRGFDELCHLTIAGSYHEKDLEAERDALHLFGVTADDPPGYYYRRVEDAHYGADSSEHATYWGAWEKVDAQIPVRKVSPIVFNGQLYLFWVRYVTKQLSKVEDGKTIFTGYQHRTYVEFCRRRMDGSWTTPQGLRLEESPFVSSRDRKDPLNYYLDDGGLLDLMVAKKDSVEQKTEHYGAFGNAFMFDVEPLLDNTPHTFPREGYTLRGFEWDRVYPTVIDGNLFLRGCDFQMWSPVDFYRLTIGPRLDPAEEHTTSVVLPKPRKGKRNPFMDKLAKKLAAELAKAQKLLAAPRVPLFSPDEANSTPRMVWSRESGDDQILFSTVKRTDPCFDEYSFATLLLEETRFQQYAKPLAWTAPWNIPRWNSTVISHFTRAQTVAQIAWVPLEAELDVVNGSVGDVIIQTKDDCLYLQCNVRRDGKYLLRRVGTSLSADIASTLFNHGLEKLLDINSQLELKEHALKMGLVPSMVHDATKTGQVDYSGPMGLYLREIYFHIPFLIADHLNSQGEFEAAQRWYHYIFDPTSSDKTVKLLPQDDTEEERTRRALDRCWRYREFRGLTLESFDAQLSNEPALEEYRRDPFNPHAIARLRLSAYQKAIVMKYVDNLLDWGDELFVRAFAQLNAEYLREATLRYVVAKEILGDRPLDLGDPQAGDESPLTFAIVENAVGIDSEFLTELESLVARQSVSSTSTTGGQATPTLTRAQREIFGRCTGSGSPAARQSKAGAGIVNQKAQVKAAKLSDVYDRASGQEVNWAPGWSVSLARGLKSAFCVPNNEEMLGYWDRVDDRLFKLRHCMDINGVVRQLPLFAPPIDPRLLVNGKAAGLSLDDILSATGGALSPYRFAYLIERAKGYAATVQSFGGAVLSALEKRDAEELARLRNTQQKNIMALTTEVKRNEIKSAEESIEATRRRQAATEYRRDYFDGLISTGLTASERTETIARGIGITAGAVRLGLTTAAAMGYLAPQVGSPFAMKYGGKEIGDSLSAYDKAIEVVSSIAEMTATVAGIVSRFERRDQDWQHQRELARHDLKAIEKDLTIAEFRKANAERDLRLHEQSQKDHDEVMEMYNDKFSNFGLYTYYSRALQQLHRSAYDNALAMARLAEQAYRFERPGDTTIFVTPDWEASRAGLLAGERLSLALQNMERRFLETNTRKAEISQSFSLAQIDPRALIALREMGSCEFAVPELYFDMAYPGQYRRRIRAVRLTIPCVTGPNTNVSAKLTLLRSFIRRDPTLGEANLLEVPLSGTASVATSSGQGDGGVFELSFNDERYLPFEGAGVISAWRLVLPARFRPFNYSTITDVILSISYIAEEDGVLREQVEADNAALEGSLLYYLTNNSLTRVLSLRHDFSTEFSRLTQAPAGTRTPLTITDRHFPLFLQGRELTATNVDIMVAPKERNTGVGSFALSINGTEASSFSAPAPNDATGGLPKITISGAFSSGLKAEHSIAVTNGGALAPDGDAVAALDPRKIYDILLVVQYQL